MRKLIIVALAITAMPVTAALASSGGFTRATVDPAWTEGSLAGTIAWDQCTGNNTGGNCDWTPIITDQPSTPDYACRGNEAIDQDPNTKVVWGGGEQTTNTTVSFDQTNVPILNGVYGQRLCLSVLWHSYYQDPVCIAEAPVLGYDPSTCPIEDHIAESAIAAVTMTVEQPTPPVTNPPPATPAPTPTTPAPAPPTSKPPSKTAPTPSLRLTAAAAAKDARIALGHSFRTVQHLKTRCSRVSNC
jgi:hypothetical protein